MKTTEGADEPRGRSVPARARRTERDVRRETRVVALVVTLLVVAAAVVVSPVAASLVLAAWGARLARPLAERLARLFGGRKRVAAALLTVAMVCFIIAPLVLGVATILPGAKTLLAQVHHARDGRGVLDALISGGSGDEERSWQSDYLDFGMQWGASASRAILIVASASLSVLIGVILFIAVFFAALVQGDRAGAWLEENAPIGRHAFRRLTGAFYQAGRGMLIGSGLTALAQGAVATILYAALGVPRALLLGVVTVAFALIPLTGPALVWIPVAVALALNGHVEKAAILVGLGLFVVGTVDNVLRPWLSRRASLGLTSVTALVAILGGVAAFGPWGILFGPLAVRLALEGLEVARETGAFGRRSPQEELRVEASSSC